MGGGTQAMKEMIGVLAIAVLFIGPLGWRVWADRQCAKADLVGAGVRAALRRTLRGESLVSVAVKAESAWRAGQVVLSVPSGHEWLVEQAWRDVIAQTPAGYEVVVRAGDPRAARPAPVPAPRELPRAA